jgi:hypothetical protein
VGEKRAKIKKIRWEKRSLEKEERCGGKEGEDKEDKVGKGEMRKRTTMWGKRERR